MARLYFVDFSVIGGKQFDLEYLIKRFHQIFGSISDENLRQTPKAEPLNFSVECATGLTTAHLVAFIDAAKEAQGKVASLKYYLVSNFPARERLTPTEVIPMAVLDTPWHKPTGDPNRP